MKTRDREVNQIAKVKKDIERYEKRKEKYQQALKGTVGRYIPLTVKGSVLYPGLLFLISLAFTGAARYLITIPVTWASLFLWSLSLIALVSGCYLVYRCLKVIQSIAVTTEETQFKKMVEALGTALETHEKAKSTNLFIVFKGKKLPLQLKCNTQNEIRFNILLAQGNAATEVEAWFFAPKGFDFPNLDTWYQGDEWSPLPSAITAKLDCENMKRGISYTHSISIKTPPEAAKYRLYYRLYCAEFHGEHQEFEINVPFYSIDKLLP